MEHAIEGCTCEGKFCKDCEQTKCLGYMHSYKNRKGEKTYKSRCRLCENQLKYTWAKANPGKVKKSSQKWLKANPDKSEARERKIRHRRRENAKAWNKANHARVKKNKEIWDKANPGRKRQQTQKWEKANLSKIIEYSAIRRARKKQVAGKFTASEWEQLKLQYNHTCLSCGKREPEIKLTADHVIPLSKGGDNYISNIQPLCQSCNSRKATSIIDYRPQYIVQEKTEQPLRQQKLF